MNPTAMTRVVCALTLVFLWILGCEVQRGDWRPISLSDGAEDGQIAVQGGDVTLRLAGQGAWGAYRAQSLEGNFDLQVEVNPDSDASCGLLLLQAGEKGPDAGSYLGIEIANAPPSPEQVRVVALEKGRDILPDHRRWKANFEYKLNSEAFGLRARALRIVHDAKAGCFHFFYRYDRTIDGQKCSGWMEFSTLPDGGKKRWFPCLSIRTAGREPAEMSFSNFKNERTLPDDPDSVGTFGARWRPYTFSGFTAPALVVSFDEACRAGPSARFVFWKEANFIPWWHIDSQCAVSYGFCETWDGGTDGCCEPMSDRLTRWSRVELLESSPVRVVVHWQYVLADPDYRWWGRVPNDKPVADKWYTFYPDGVGVRKLTYTPALTSHYPINWNEITEIQVISRGGVRPSELIQQTALSMLNLQGRRVDLTWDLSKKTPPARSPDEAKNWEEAICRVNLLNRPSPFIAFAQGVKTSAETFPQPFKTWWANYGADWNFQMRGGYEFEGDFWTFSHWPINKMPYEDPVKTNGKYVREAAHTSLLSVPGSPGVKGPTTWAMLIGIADSGADQQMRQFTASWLYPGDIVPLKNSCRFERVDVYERAMVLECATPGKICHFRLIPEGTRGPTLNPVFRLRNWGVAAPAVRLDGRLLESGKDYRYARNKGDLLLWIRATISKPAEFAVEPTTAKP